MAFSVQDMLHSMHLKELVCPLYSLDLALYDFHVFSPLKKALKLL